MIFFVGRHAMFGQDPPMYFRSIEAVRFPSRAIVQAISLPPVPLPNTRTSYFSGSLVATTASLELAAERLRFGVATCDDLSVGAAGFGAAVLIGLSNTSRGADRFALQLRLFRFSLLVPFSCLCLKNFGALSSDLCEPAIHE